MSIPVWSFVGHRLVRHGVTMLLVLCKLPLFFLSQALKELEKERDQFEQYKREEAEKMKMYYEEEARKLK